MKSISQGRAHIIACKRRFWGAYEIPVVAQNDVVELIAERTWKTVFQDALSALLSFGAKSITSIRTAALGNIG